MPDRSDIDRILTANQYCVLGTADQAGHPWVTPVFFAPLGADQVCWVSSPNSRHSRNIAGNAAIAITVYDSTVPVGRGEAAYFDADAAQSSPKDIDDTLRALNARLPRGKELNASELQPSGPLAIYHATIQHRYILVRGGNPEYRNALDMTVEV